MLFLTERWLSCDSIFRCCCWECRWWRSSCNRCSCCWWEWLLCGCCCTSGRLLTFICWSADLNCLPLLHLRYSTRSEFMPIASPNPVSAERKTARMAFTLSCILKEDESTIADDQEHLKYWDKKVEKEMVNSAAYDCIKYMSKEDDYGELETGISPNVTPAHCHHPVSKWLSRRWWYKKEQKLFQSKQEWKTM